MKILIVEDDLALSDVISFTLSRAGFEIIVAYDGLSALHTWEQEQPDLVVLDLNLPKLDGFAVCRHLCSHGTVPIIMLSVRNDDADVVKGLELGADDYIVKPFSPTQLVARVRAVLRRVGKAPTQGLLKSAHLSLDRARQEVHLSGQSPIRLTPLEYRLLEALMLHTGHVLSTDNLINTVWGSTGGDRTMLKQLVYRLRAKIEPDPAQPTYIETIPGMGYALADK
jgi:DNA-binding response OmpR family regulator